MDRASQVCINCKLRKKQCDKKLPTCSYCAKRALPCSYDYTPASLNALSAAATKWSTNSPPPAPLLALDSLASMSDAETLRESLNNRVLQLLDAASVTFLHVTETFFNGFHQLLPVVCPTTFDATLSALHGRPPPPEVSILVLAMCMLALHPPSGTVSDQIVEPLNMYKTLKMLFAFVQTQLPPSLTLVQAGILLAAYEYTCDQPSISCVSLSTCTRMARVIGLGEYTLNRTESGLGPTSLLQLREQKNVWWGIVIMERKILSEIPNIVQQRETLCPGPEAYLPQDFDPSTSAGPNVFEITQMYGDARRALSEGSTALVGSVDQSQNVGGFGRLAQVSCLVDLVFDVIFTPANEEERILKLDSLSEQFRGLFYAIANDKHSDDWIRGHEAIATLFRNFLFLHQCILNELKSSRISGGSYEHWTMKSIGALQTLAQHFSTVAHHHVLQLEANEAKADALPMCSRYNYRAVMNLFQDLDNTGTPNALMQEVETLAALRNFFDQRWSTISIAQGDS